MNKDTLVALKDETETKYFRLAQDRDSYKAKYDETVTELARIQGEFRAYESLVDGYVEPPVVESDRAQIIPVRVK